MTSSREEAACSLRVAKDEREPRGIESASCARHKGGGIRGVVGNGRRKVVNTVLSSGRVGREARGGMGGG